MDEACNLEGTAIYNSENKRVAQDFRISCASFSFQEIVGALCLRELILTNQTHGAFKIIGNILPGSVGGDTAFGIAPFLIIFPAAKVTYIFHKCCLR